MDLSHILDSTAYRAARDVLHTSDAVTVQHMCDAALIAAPTGAERARADWFAVRLRELGLKPSFDEAGNVIATSPGNDERAPRVVIAAHLDTVFGSDVDIVLRRDRNRIHAPGI